MPLYERARKAEPIHELIQDLIDEHHGDLMTLAVTFDVLWATPSGEGPALQETLQGCSYPVAMVPTITPLKQRVLGVADAILEIDKKWWQDASDAERLAQLDHQLQHYEVARDEENAVKLDDQNRPRLKKRPHDIVCGGFSAVARRHGDASLEVASCKAAYEEFRQEVFAWLDEQPVPATVPMKARRKDAQPAVQAAAP